MKFFLYFNLFDPKKIAHLQLSFNDPQYSHSPSTFEIEAVYETILINHYNFARHKPQNDPSQLIQHENPLKGMNSAGASEDINHRQTRVRRKSKDRPPRRLPLIRRDSFENPGRGSDVLLGTHTHRPNGKSRNFHGIRRVYRLPGRFISFYGA